MKRGKFYAVTLLVFSIGGAVGLAAWNFFQVRTATLHAHARWAQKVSDEILSDRLSTSRWLNTLRGMSVQELKAELFSHSELAGAYWFDVKGPVFVRYVRPEYDSALKAPEPRMILTQIKAAETQKQQLGPVLVMPGKLFNTVAQPLDKTHVLIAILEAPELRIILEQESQRFGLHVFVYD